MDDPTLSPLFTLATESPERSGPIDALFPMLKGPDGMLSRPTDASDWNNMTEERRLPINDDGDCALLSSLMDCDRVRLRCDGPSETVSSGCGRVSFRSVGI